MSERKYDSRVYRAQGQRPDGTIVTADYLSRAKAEKALQKMRLPRTVETEQGMLVFPPLENVRLIRSAPLRWIYPEQNA